MFNKLKLKVSRKNILLVVAVFLLLFLVIKVARSVSQKNRAVGNTSSSEETKPKAYIQIDKSFEFVAVDANKKEVPVTFTVVSAERKDDIKVKGENRKPVVGRDYLLLRIEIQNSKIQRVAMTTADRIRLDEGGRLFAPDYHNGNVVIDPISTKKDLLAFAVDTKQKSFVFQVGELDGEKQKIEVNF